MHNVLCPRDLVSNPDNMDETALHAPLSNTFFSMPECVSLKKSLKILLSVASYMLNTIAKIKIENKK